MFHEVEDMLLFAAVARAGSLTRAGQALGLPKSSISRRMAALEERVGSRLLHKTTRRLVLTEAGEAFLEHCQRLSDEADRALAFAGELAHEPRGTVRMTLPHSLTDSRLLRALGTFVQRYPSINVEVDESTRYVDLAAERFDLALRAGELPDSSLVARRLYDLSSGIFASPEYLARCGTPRSPDELHLLEFAIMQGLMRHTSFELQRAAERAQIELTGRISVISSAMQLGLALCDAAAIVHPIIYAQSAVRAGQLVRILPEWTVPGRTFWIVTPSRRLLARKTTLLIEHLLAAFA